MGTETRIGIATGLLIVVVASVYFFYGSDRSAEDLLIATGGPAAEPPKIPADRGDRLASRKALAPPQQTTERPARLASHLPGHQPQWKPSATKPQVGTGAAPAVPARQSTKRPAPNQWRLPLRTGPSDALIEATRQNALAASPTSPIGQAARKDASRGASAEPIKPAVSWPTRHKISEGDTLSDISLRYYATSAQVKHILRANLNIKNPKALKIGDILIIPAPAPITPAHAADKGRGDFDGSPGSAAPTTRRYRVQSGDTLYRISRKMLGNPSRWKEIYDRNRAVIGKDPLRLKPGMLLTLPG